MTSTQLDFFSSPVVARDEALHRVERNADDWTKALVDQAILAVIDEYGEASMNECRDLLPELPQRNLIGARMRSLALRKEITWVRDVRSTDPGTHAKKIGVYRRAVR